MRINWFWKRCFFSFAILFFAFIGTGVGILNAVDSVVLKYTYRPDQNQVAVLKDSQGKMYLPLADIAKFYGIALQFDPQTRRVFLSKGKNQVKLVLSQPMFLVSNPTESFSTDPVEEIAGQLAVTPITAQDLLAAILGIDTQFASDQQALVVGGIRSEELKKEIVAQEQTSPASSKNIVAPVSPVGSSASSVLGARGEEEPAQAPVVVRSRVDSTRGYHVRRIVIDAGHGGKDVGAKGYDNRYYEKQATLAIATKVVRLLQKHPELTIFMTRNKDYFVTLKGRTQFANKNKADLFVSIHCNSTPRGRESVATGTEIYVYSSKSSTHSADFAARLENTGGEKTGFSGIGFGDLYYKRYETRSISAAKNVWGFIHKRLGQHMRSVQRANFYVLARVDMPSILIETAFISNPKEEFKLEDPDWQDKMAQSIADGILAYRDVAESSVDAQQTQ
jgi:N-acetylmuramoyl-L-alanine amidase